MADVMSYIIKGNQLIMNKLIFLKQVFFICSILIILNPLNTAVADENWNISVQGIKIVGSGYKNASEEIMPFNQFKGCAIACLLTIRTGKIISFSEVESTIKEFKDNVGTNLIDSNAMFGNGFE